MQKCVSSLQVYVSLALLFDCRTEPFRLRCVCAFLFIYLFIIIIIFIGVKTCFVIQTSVAANRLIDGLGLSK